MKNIFTDKALKLKKKNSESTIPTQILTSPIKTSIYAGIIVAIGGLFWSIFARVPIQVSGTGYILPYRGVATEKAEASGYIRLMHSEEPFDWENKAFQFFKNPKLLSSNEVTRLASNIYSSYDLTKSCIDNEDLPFYESYNNECDFEDDQTLASKMYPKGKLMTWIQSVAQREKLQRQLLDLEDLKNSTKLEILNTNKKIYTFQAELQSRSEYLGQMKKLEAKGSISTTVVLQNESNVDNLKNKILDLINHKTSIKLRLAKSENELRKLLGEIISDSMIFSRHRTYIMSLIPTPFEFVSQGQTIMLTTTSDQGSPDIVPMFMQHKDSSQVFSGMEGQATPEGFNKSESGAIKFSVVSVDTLSSSESEITYSLGDEQEAKYIVQTYQTPMEATINLSKATKNNKSRVNGGGYEWTSTGDLPFPPKMGDRLNIKITTRKVSPLTLAIPTLKRFFGFAPPTKKSENNTSKK